MAITYIVGSQLSFPIDYVFPYNGTTYIAPAYTTSYISTDGVSFSTAAGLNPIDRNGGFYSHEQESAKLGSDMYIYMYDYDINENILLRYDGSSYSVQSLPQGFNYTGNLASNGTIIVAPEGNDKTDWVRYNGSTVTIFDPEPVGETWPSGGSTSWQCATYFNGQFITVPTNNFDGTTAAVFSSDGINWSINENFFTDELAYYVDFIKSPDLLVIRHGSYRTTFFTYDGSTLTFRTLPAEFDAVIGTFDRDCKIIYDQYREVFHVIHLNSSGELYIANTVDFETYTDMEQLDASPTTYIELLQSYATPDGLVLHSGGDGVYIQLEFTPDVVIPPVFTNGSDFWDVATASQFVKFTRNITTLPYLYNEPTNVLAVKAIAPDGTPYATEYVSVGNVGIRTITAVNTVGPYINIDPTYFTQWGNALIDAVEVSDSYIFAAHRGSQPGTPDEYGAVVILNLDGTLKQFIPSPITTDTPVFGTAVAYQPGTENVFISAPYINGFAPAGGGFVYKYNTSGTQLASVQHPAYPDWPELGFFGGEFGDKLKVQGNNLFVGSPRSAGNSIGSYPAGAVWVFDLNLNYQTVLLTEPSGPLFNNAFGQSIYVDENYIAACGDRAAAVYDRQSYARIGEIDLRPYTGDDDGIIQNDTFKVTMWQGNLVVYRDHFTTPEEGEVGKKIGYIYLFRPTGEYIRELFIDEIANDATQINRVYEIFPRGDELIVAGPFRFAQLDIDVNIGGAYIIKG